MAIELEYGDLIRYEHPDFGMGLGAVVGKVDKSSNDYYIRPRAKLSSKKYPDGVFICNVLI
jgi:hypothetical protein